MADLQKYPVLRFLKFLANVAWYLGAVAGGIAILAFILLTAFQPDFIETDAMMQIPVYFDEGKGPVIPVDSDNRNVWNVDYVAESGMLQFSSQPWFLIVYGALFFLGALPVYLFSVYSIRMIFKNLSERDPFIMENVTHMRNAGFGLIGGSLIVGVGLIIIEIMMRNDFFVEGVKIHFGRDSGGETLLAGLVLLVLAEVFRAGVKINEEQKLTI